MSSEFTASPQPLAGLPASSRKWRRNVALAALASCVALAGLAAKATYFQDSASPAAAQAAAPRAGRGPAVTAEVAPVLKGDFQVTLSGLGTVTSLATSVVKSQISGQLQQINFHEGQLIKAGDILAQVDPRPYRLALAQAEGLLRRDAALLANAERDLIRYETLRQRMADAVSGQQVDTQRALIDQYKGTVAIDTAQVDQARLNLDYCRIVSLIDGRIGLRLVDQGNYVQANDSSGVAVVTQLSPITIVFTLPAGELPAALRAYRSGRELTVIAYDNDRSKELARGRLSAIDNQIDAATGTVKLRAVFANENERLYPNQFVNVELLVDNLRDVTLAPAAAVRQGAKGPFAYVVRPDNVVAARQLKLGPANGDSIVIENGLQPGDRVVTAGGDRLREGAEVAAPAGPKAKPANAETPGKPSGASRAETTFRARSSCVRSPPRS
jgi:multidrug efflux system membrane fusion protein